MLFEEQVARKPNLYPWTDEFIERIWSSFWTPSEFDFQSDHGQFVTEMSQEERDVVVRALSAIGQIEIEVKTFWARLGERLPHPSLSDLGFAMANTEVIHNKAYEKLLDRLGLTEVFEENLGVPVVRDRVSYLKKHNRRMFDDDRKQYVYSIILFTLFVENVSLFSQFYVVLWFNRNKNWLKDTAQQIQYTRNEEMLHAQVGMRIINVLRSEYPEYFDEEMERLVYAEVLAAEEAESRLVAWILGEYRGEGLDHATVTAFVKNRFNDSLRAIGFEGLFVVDDRALEKTIWMDEETIGNNVTDFFMKKPVDYAKKNRVYKEDDLF